jgi:hypothetical protein
MPYKASLVLFEAEALCPARREHGVEVESVDKQSQDGQKKKSEA